MNINNKDAKINQQINIENNHGNINIGNPSNLGNNEKTNTNKNALKSMIARNQLKEVLAQLMAQYPSNNDFLLLNSQLSGLISKNRIGVISNSEYNLERNKITASVLDLIDEL